MTNVELKVGDKVSWIRPMTCVPHPEDKTDRDGNVLPVFRDKLEKGRVIRRKTTVKAVNDISLTIYPGETFSVVGESGCGKSGSQLSVMQLIPFQC